MANYFVINNKFKPYSFDELIKPYQMYGEEYRRQEAAIDSLLAEASSLEDLSPTLDKAEYNKYNEWKNSLKQVSDSLSSNGLSHQTRNAIRNLGNSYKSEYAPMLDKLKMRGALIKEQRDYLQKNPNTIFDIDYSQTPVGDISTASTYNSYNLDTIKAQVGQDVYNKQSAGEAVPSLNEYTTMYSGNLTDPEQIRRVQEAVNAGATLGNATYKQKEFENYLNKVKATKSYSSGSSGSRTSGTSRSVSAITAYDGTSIIPSYDKTTKQYKIKNKDKKDVVLPENFTADDVLRSFYGGDYGYVNVFGTNVPRVRTTETAPDGSSRDVYSILLGNSWKQLPEGGSTRKRDLYKKITGENIAGLTESERKARRGVVTDESLEKQLKRENWKRDDVNFHDYESDLGESLVKKLTALENIGATINLTLYRDKNNRVLGWDIATSGDDLDAPIEYVDNYK